MRPLLFTCLLALPTASLAHHPDGRDWTDGVKAGGYIGGMATLFGAAGGILGGLLGYALSPDDCPKDAADCGSALPLLGVAGFGAGYIWGFWLGGTWYDAAENFDGSFLAAALGALIGGSVAGAVSTEIYDAADGAGWAAGVGAGLGLAGMAVGAGLGYVWFGEEKGAVALDPPFVTPIGEAGYGIGLSGRF